MNTVDIARLVSLDLGSLSDQRRRGICVPGCSANSGIVILGHVEKYDNWIGVARFVELGNGRQARDAVGADMGCLVPSEQRIQGCDT